MKECIISNHELAYVSDIKGFITYKLVMAGFDMNKFIVRRDDVEQDCIIYKQGKGENK